MTSTILHDSIAPGLASVDTTLCSVCRTAYTEPCGVCGGGHHARHCRTLYALLYSNAVLPAPVLARLLCSHRTLAYDFLEGLPELLLAEQADVLAAWLSRHLAGASGDALLSRWAQQFHDETIGRVPYRLLAA